MFRKLLSVVVSFLIVVPSLSAEDNIEAGLPPSYVYTADQLAIINSLGLPWQFNIFLKQVGKFRYETWYYGGTIKKKFGFVNGKKELEAPFSSPLSEEAKIVGFEPKNFTFNTTRNNLRQMFGAPDKIFPGKDPKVRQEAHTYPRRGVGANFIKGKIDTVTTIPPSNSSASRNIKFEALLNTLDTNFRHAETSADAPPTHMELVALAVALMAVLLVTEAIVELELSENEKEVEEALEKYYTARTILDHLTAITSGKELKNAINGAVAATKTAVNASPVRNASLDYINKIPDVRNTMQTTTGRSDLFPLTFHNQTNITGEECGASPVTVQVFLDGRAIASVAPGGTFAVSVNAGTHNVDGCFVGSGCTGIAPVTIPKNTNWFFYWVCNSIQRSIGFGPATVN